MQIGNGGVEELFFCDAFRVFGDVFEEERNLRAVLHGSDEEVCQL